MLIVRILFAASDAHLPYVIGGGPMDIHHLALTFQAEGHEVAVAAALPGGRRLLPYRVRQQVGPNRLVVSRDDGNGYDTFRALPWLVPRLVRQRISEQPPDMVIVQGGAAKSLARAAAGEAAPVVMRTVDMGSVELLASAVKADRDTEALLRNPLVRVVSVSHFLGSAVRELLDIPSTVIYPLIRLEDCVFPDRRPQHITFVNPIPFKGLAVVLQVAALLPHRKFLFIEAWHRPRAQRRELARELERLPNVIFRQRSTELGKIYQQTAVLFMPTQGPEGFGRVAIEACANGIPVVASRIGGIPEALGNSGLLLEPSDPPKRWAETIEGLLSDPDRYSRLAAGARANVQRREFQTPVIVDQFLDIFSRTPVT